MTLQELLEKITSVLGAQLQASQIALDELTITVDASGYYQSMQKLRDHADLAFDMLVDLCGVDYSTYQDQSLDGAPRYCIVNHLLSIKLNQRVRVKVFCADSEFPMLPTITPLWAAANWFERETFDLYGVVFDGHPDMRRILTDYGFIGHPMRKDFPVSGYVEMRYDAETKRVVYQPVSIEPRENTPRIIREADYGRPAVGASK